MFVLGGNSSGKSYCGVVNVGYHIIPEEDIYGKLTGKTIHPHMDLRIPSTGIEGWISCWSEDNQIDTLHPLVDKLLLPYAVSPPPMKDGAYQRMYFKGGSWINFKTQTQKVESYRGPKKRFVYLDEPHKEQIYKEARARLLKSGGYMWICMTPIIDENSPLSSRDVIWMRDEILEPYDRDPEKYPLREVIFLDVEDNYAHLPGRHLIEETLNGMSAHERAIRKSGTLLVFTGRHCFNSDVILTIRQYLYDHPEESTPEYGTLAFDPNETGLWEVQFEKSEDDYFPDKPSGNWRFRVWEHPVTRDNMQVNPGYTISVDVAEGKPGGDFTSAYVFRNDTRRIVAGLHGHIPEEELAKELYLIGHYYMCYNDQPALMAIEIRNYGRMTQKFMMIGSAELGIMKYPGHRFYYRPTAKDLALGRQYAHAPGWDTNAATRGEVIMSMRAAFIRAYNQIATGKHCPIPDIACLNEATEFIMRKSGRYEGYPDDRLFGLGIGHCVLDRPEASRVIEEEPKQELSDNQHFYADREESGLESIRFNIEGIFNTIAKGKSGDIRF